MNRSVGLVILTEVPGLGLAAVLKERGYFDFEKMKPESWPGGCQVTVHGGVNENEHFLTALHREMEEELGKDFSDSFWSNTSRKITEVHAIRTSEKEIVTFAAKVHFGLLPGIKLSPESGAIRFLFRNEIGKISDLANYPKNTGVTDRRKVAMFSDEEAAVLSAFARNV